MNKLFIDFSIFWNSNFFNKISLQILLNSLFLILILLPGWTGLFLLVFFIDKTNTDIFILVIGILLILFGFYLAISFFIPMKKWISHSLYLKKIKSRMIKTIGIIQSSQIKSCNGNYIYELKGFFKDNYNNKNPFSIEINLAEKQQPPNEVVVFYDPVVEKGSFTIIYDNPILKHENIFSKFI